MELSELNTYIYRRKSIRNYIDSPVDEGLIDELVDFLSAQKLPDESIEWDFDILPYPDIAGIAARPPGVKAPHYLVLRSQQKQFCLQNVGYLGELASLWLCTRGLASCWQSGVNATNDFKGLLPFITCLAFGSSEEAMREDESEYERIPLKKIINRKFNQDYLDIAKAVRVAPSAMNRQPVRLLGEASQIHVYRKSVLFNNPFIAIPQCIDSGAAIAHLHISASLLGYSVTFKRTEDFPMWGKNIYQATAVLERI